MRFQVGLQERCMHGCIVTLVAFVCLLPTVCFQMSHQIACMRGCIVTLVAFVWFGGIVFHKAIIQFQVFIFKRPFHFWNVNFVVLSVRVALNWGKFNRLKCFWTMRAKIESEREDTETFNWFQQVSEKWIHLQTCFQLIKPVAACWSKSF